MARWLVAVEEGEVEEAVVVVAAVEEVLQQLLKARCCDSLVWVQAGMEHGKGLGCCRQPRPDSSAVS